MTETQNKALALVNEVNKTTHHRLDAAYPYQFVSALCRAIERDEAFRQEVSDAVEEYADRDTHAPITYLGRFIITKPDPLVDAWGDMLRDSKPGEDRLEVFRAALAARGLKIVEDK